MFISEDEALRRISDPNNLANRLPATEILSPPSLIIPEPPVVVPLSPDESFDLDDLLSPKQKEINAHTLDRLLNPVPRGRRNLGTDHQAAVGVTASILGTTRASRIGGVAISTAHSNERGYTSPTDLVNPNKNPKQVLAEKIIEGHSFVVDKCFNRLLKTLDLLDDEKLESMRKPTEISIVARNLSGILGQATAATQERIGGDIREQSVHFHIMKPEQSSDTEYPVIDVSKVGIVT